MIVALGVVALLGCGRMVTVQAVEDRKEVSTTEIVQKTAFKILIVYVR